MENQSNQATKKGLILLIGILIGLLTGVLVAFLLVNRMNPKSPSEVKVVMPESQGGKDTVYKYVIHQYQSDSKKSSQSAESDSVLLDSLYRDANSVDFMLDDDSEESLMAQQSNATVTSERMVSRHEIPVLYFDANKNAIEAPERALKMVEVQFWSTPIRNKIAYKFEGNVLKIKGLTLDEPNIVHYNDRYYLQCERRIYLIQPTSEYKRLAEIHDVSFN